MPKIKAQVDELVLKCMKLYNWCRGSLFVSEIMELSRFSEGEQNCGAKHAWIYCCIKSLGLYHNKRKPPPVPVDIAVEDRTVSSMTSASLKVPLQRMSQRK
jgi:hypothetical protein